MQLQHYKGAPINETYVGVNHGTLEGAVNNSLGNTQKKTQIAPPNVTEIADGRVWTHLRMSSKNGLKCANKCKMWPIKNESKTKDFSAPGDAHDNANGTTMCLIRAWSFNLWCTW